MKSATGIVNVNFCDEKGHSIEILKEFREFGGDKEE